MSIMSIMSTDFSLLLFPFSWNYAAILLSSVLRHPIPRINQVCNFPKWSENATIINVLEPKLHTFLLLKPVLHCKSVAMIKNVVTFSPVISILGEATETTWCPVNMPMLSCCFVSLQFVCFLFKKAFLPWKFECQGDKMLVACWQPVSNFWSLTLHFWSFSVRGVSQIT